MGRIMQRMWTFLGFTDDEGGGPSQGDVAGYRAPIFNLHAHRPMEIIVLEPRVYEEAQGAADYLKTLRPIVINLRGTQQDLGRRVVDFLSGVAYALDGHMHRVGDEIFLFTPHHVTITADVMREETAPGPLFSVE
ncbi:MAG TPA: cell division protein SepF [bacterium]|nr:cell division protein SepF [bacterium]